MVRFVLEDKYKKGYISTSGVDVLLSGNYKENPIYTQILGVINDF
jgi:hypothetical protein